MATEQIYREANRRSHKLLGSYLAYWCWVHDVDCVVLERGVLLQYLGLKRMKNKRIDWLKNDVKDLFGYARTLKYAKTGNYSTLCLSRCDFPLGAFAKTMSNQKRVELLREKGLASEIATIPSEEEIVSILARMIHGIGDFQNPTAD